MVVDADEYDTVIAQEISGEVKSRVHHVEPLGVKATVRLSIC
jgi:hypothetical protein